MKNCAGGNLIASPDKEWFTSGLPIRSLNCQNFQSRRPIPHKKRNFKTHNLFSGLKFLDSPFSMQSVVNRISKWKPAHRRVEWVEVAFKGKVKKVWDKTKSACEKCTIWQSLKTHISREIWKKRCFYWGTYLYACRCY